MSEDQEIIKNVRPNRDIEFLFEEYRYFFRLLDIEKNLFVFLYLFYSQLCGVRNNRNTTTKRRRILVGINKFATLSKLSIDEQLNVS